MKEKVNHQYNTRRLWKVLYNDVTQCYSEFFYFTENERSLILVVEFSIGL